MGKGSRKTGAGPKSPAIDPHHGNAQNEINQMVEGDLISSAEDLSDPAPEFQTARKQTETSVVHVLEGVPDLQLPAALPMGFEVSHVTPLLEGRWPDADKASWDFFMALVLAGRLLRAREIDIAIRQLLRRRLGEVLSVNRTNPEAAWDSRWEAVAFHAVWLEDRADDLVDLFECVYVPVTGERPPEPSPAARELVLARDNLESLHHALATASRHTEGASRDWLMGQCDERLHSIPAIDDRMSADIRQKVYTALRAEALPVWVGQVDHPEDGLWWLQMCSPKNQIMPNDHSKREPALKDASGADLAESLRRPLGKRPGATLVNEGAKDVSTVSEATSECAKAASEVDERLTPEQEK